MATWLQLGFQDASSPLMEELIYFHDYVLIMLVLITMIVFYGLFSLLFMYSTNRFFLDSQIVETMWTVVPAFILVFMAFPSLQLLYLIDEVNDPCLTMKALGHQWYWSYEFTDYHSLDFDSYMISVDDMSFGSLRLLEVDNRVIIPSHNSMRVLVSSSDVLHSWAVPSLGMKMDAVPGRLNQVTFMIPRSGLFYGQCSEICGSNHSFMPIVLESVPFKVFETWVSNYIVD